MIWTILILLLIGAAVMTDWFLELVTGAALLSIPIAAISGNFDVAAFSLLIFIVCVWRMTHDGAMP